MFLAGDNMLYVEDNSCYTLFPDIVPAAFSRGRTVYNDDITV